MASSSIKSHVKLNPVKESFINFFELTKARLAISVVFSSLAGYLIASDSFDLSTVLLLALGGYCMVGASNSFNQIIEKDIDKLMDRTKNRPIPSEKMSINTAFIISILGVLIFAGLTAYDTQKIKNMYLAGDNMEVSGKKSVMGALTLYLDFILMFQFLLMFLGNRE